MIWIILGVAISILVGIVVAIIDRDPAEVIFGVVFGIFGAIFGFLIAILVGAGQGNSPYEFASERPLAALNDSVGSRGSFLGFNPSGSFVYYEQTKENTYQMRIVRSRDATVVETDEPPRVVKEKSPDDLKAWYMQFGDVDRYIFYIPKGSIIMNYRLDAQ